MHAAIIAAGKGERLNPHFPGLPKPLLPIKSKTLIDWQIEQLEKAEFSDVSIVIREDHKDVAEYLKRIRTSLKLNIITRNTVGGMYSLFCLEEYLSEEEDFFLFTIDNIFEHNELLRFVKSKNTFTERTLTTWITKRIEDNKNQVGIEIDGNSRIIDIGKQLKDTPLIAEGPYHCYQSVFSAKRLAEKFSINRLSDYLRLLIKARHTMYGYYVSQVFDIDDFDDYQKAMKFIK